MTITTLKEIIGNPVTVFNSLDPSTQATIIWTTGLLLLILAACIVIGITKNTAKTAVGSNTKDAKMSTEGITGNVLIGGTLLVGIIVIGIALGLIMGI